MYFKKTISVKLVIIIISLLSLFQFGCSSQPHSPYFFDKSQDVILGPGDVLNIQFPYTPEHNAVQMVRPDGKIALQLIGEVEVKGITPKELQEKLIQLYSKQLQLPEITVTVDSFYSNRIYVSGAVNNPGLLDFPGRLTAFEAIMEAGGFDLVTANIEKVMVIRYENGVRNGYKLNYRPTIEGKESPVFFLQPFDVVFIPEKKSVLVGRWIDQHIDGMVPGILASSAMMAFILSNL